MSLLRRVKSFAVKKSKTLEELRSLDEEEEEHLPRRQYKARKKGLNRQKSMSLEFSPVFRLDLESNDLFRRQKAKLEKTESTSDLPYIPENKLQFQASRTIPKLNKRESMSLDDFQFSGCIPEFASSIEYRNCSAQNAARKRSRFRTIDGLGELLNEFPENIKSDVGTKIGRFPFPPLDKNEEVEIRRPSYTSKHFERPKTIASQNFSKKKEERLELKGPFRLEIGDEICVKLKSKESIRLANNALGYYDESGQKKQTLKENVQIKKGTKFINKTELEMTDIDKTIYRFYFNSSKDAKSFADNEKSRSGVTKTNFSMSQLLKLLTKRSSKDMLEEKGILKNEPVFGNTLSELCNDEYPVPEVVTRIVALIELNENIINEGLYRASANLAIVQNIRCEINCGRYEILEKHRNDVDVLAGTLKLFFRELKEPLLPQKNYEELRDTLETQSNLVGQIIDKLPIYNKATLLFLVKHLINVSRHKKVNKMDIHNLSICWGPSLISYSDTCSDLVLQTAEFTKITELILSYYQSEFQDNQTEESLVPAPAPRTSDFVYDVVRKFTELIQPHVTVEGIYRKSGSSTKIEKIMKILDTKKLSDLDKKHDIHDLCCAFKKYLSSTNEPLLTDDFFTQYCNICDTMDSRWLNEELRNMIERLPRRDAFLVLLQHLRSVIQCEKKNKMSMESMSGTWMLVLVSPKLLQQKNKVRKFSTLFQDLMTLNASVLPDLLQKTQTRSPKPKQRARSRYDNVDEDLVFDGSSTKL